VIGRRDPEHVRAGDRVDHLVAALEDDADRDAALRRDPPRGVDPRSLVDDRNRVVVDGSGAAAPLSPVPDSCQAATVATATTAAPATANRR